MQVRFISSGGRLPFQKALALSLPTHRRTSKPTPSPTPSPPSPPLRPLSSEQHLRRRYHASYLPFPPTNYQSLLLQLAAHIHYRHQRPPRAPPVALHCSPAKHAYARNSPPNRVSPDPTLQHFPFPSLPYPIPPTRTDPALHCIVSDTTSPHPHHHYHPSTRTPPTTRSCETVTDKVFHLLDQRRL